MKVEKDEYCNWRRKVCNDDDETTASGRPFQTSAAATGKARLPTVDSLMGGATRRLTAQRQDVNAPDIVAHYRETL